jgi:hypothetical protein
MAANGFGSSGPDREESSSSIGSIESILSISSILHLPAERPPVGLPGENRPTFDFRLDSPTAVTYKITVVETGAK